MTDINIGQITEALNDKMDRDAHNTQSPSAVVIEKQDPTSENGWLWYRKYSDGWVEQGGRAKYGVGTSGTATLPVVMANNDYSITSNNGNDAGNNTFTVSVPECTTTYIKWYKSASAMYGNWQICGYAAS